MGKYELVHTNIFLLLWVKEPKKNNTTVAMSTFNTQYLVSNTIFQKETKTYWRNC